MRLTGLAGQHDFVLDIRLVTSNFAEISEIMTPPSPTNSPDTPRKIDLNLTQVAAGSLAAVTAAALGSRLGIAGTLVGAAAASMTLTVGTALYRASLERSQAKLRALARRTQTPTPRTEDRAAWWRSLNLRWGTVVVGALGAFVLAMLVITGFEAVRGETLGGHGEGTSIGRVVTPPDSPDPAVPPVPDTSVTPSPEITPTGTPAPTPEVTPDDETDGEESPSEDTDTPTPAEGEPTPPPVPPVLPIPRS